VHLTKVIFMLKHSAKLRRYINWVMWQHVVERHVYCVHCTQHTETCRSDTIVYFKVNLKFLTKLMNSAFVGE